MFLDPSTITSLSNMNIIWQHKMQPDYRRPGAPPLPPFKFPDPSTSPVSLTRASSITYPDCEDVLLPCNGFSSSCSFDEGTVVEQDLLSIFPAAAATPIPAFSDRPSLRRTNGVRRAHHPAHSPSVRSYFIQHGSGTHTRQPSSSSCSTTIHDTDRATPEWSSSFPSSTHKSSKGSYRLFPQQSQGPEPRQSMSCQRPAGASSVSPSVRRKLRSIATASLDLGLSCFGKPQSRRRSAMPSIRSWNLM